jgi:ABC-type phosphate/phosphonate transport system ATPase subunit/GNAT superfamily N-acetyltransferase
MSTYSVQSTQPKGHKKQLILTDGAKSSIHLQVPRFACVGKGDQIRISSEHPENIFSVSSEDQNDLIRICPHFERSATTSIGSTKYQLRLTEISRPEDLAALSFLEQFHYKSLAAEDDQEAPLFGTKTRITTTGGRKAVVLLYVKLRSAWVAAGYIELQMPLMMCKPRHELFDAPFNHGSRPISWVKWDQHAIRRYVNSIVRIARVVVHPEFRGLGLARVLVDTAKQFATERWQISGRRPLFIEISAQMLTYIDFVSSSGFHYVDLTEGNAARVVKDLSYMQKGYEVSSGIMSLQKKYLSSLESYCRETRIPIEEALQRLTIAIQSEDPLDNLNPAEWAAFRKVLRQRLPYYVCGLDDDASAYLRPIVRDRKPLSKKKPLFAVTGARIDLRGLTVQATVPLPQTRNVRLIMEAFGLEGDALETQVLPPVDLKASAGNIVLIVGASGSGKSALLKALDPSHAREGGLTVRPGGRQDYSCGWLNPLPSGIPLFDYFATHYGPERSFAALSKVGLSEAFVMVKPFSLLSRGQQYRTMLADLLLREEQVWLLDEFCADLDPLSARIVAHNFRKMVMASNRIAIVAAANHGHYLDALRPTQVVELRAGGETRHITFKDYRDELFSQAV